MVKMPCRSCGGIHHTREACFPSSEDYAAMSRRDTAMADMDGYRTLRKGELIEAGDEGDCCVDAWRDDPEWEPATNIGEPAPDPRYPAHRRYRRKKKPADT